MRNTTVLPSLHPPATAPRARPYLYAGGVFLLAFAVYNANGREIASADTAPTKFAAIELVRYHTLALDRVVQLVPALAQRPGVTRDRDGHYRSTYPVLPSLIAAGPAWVLHRLRLVDLRAPRAGGLVAKLTASLLTALSVAIVFLVARRRLDLRAATLVAVGFGLGTNVWAVSSQTLWQSETALLMLSAVPLCLAVPVATLTWKRLAGSAVLLGLAGAARPQLAPAIAIIALSIATRRRRATDLLALVPLLLLASAVLASNLHWFGHLLGAAPRLEALHPDVHRVSGSRGNPLAGALGLLVSPSRGLLVFSPIVLVALASLPALRREGWRDDLRWWALAALTQFAFYANYSVWWGGHTYGPRYCLDLLPLLVPLAVAGLPALRARSWYRRLAAVALAWSIALAATGAFVYPHELWNSEPDEVDRNHARLWQWSDPQFVRCWKSGLSPQNFSLSNRATWRWPPDRF